MASTSDSLPSSLSLPTTTAGLDASAEQEFTSHHQNLFLPCSSSSPASSLYLDSFGHGLLPTSSSTAMSSPSPPPPPAPPLPPHHPPAPSKPGKKRPRASRRPPTTVLTTDTSNFRAMVQEFTGFPAPPFAAAPPPAVRPRLLGGGPPFLMRPSPLKYQLQNSMLLPPGSCTTTTQLLPRGRARAVRQEQRDAAEQRQRICNAGRIRCRRSPLPRHRHGWVLQPLRRFRSAGGRGRREGRQRRRPWFLLLLRRRRQVRQRPALAIVRD